MYTDSTRIWSNPYLGQIRLIGETTVNQGLVEVYCNGQWGTVCDDGFGQTEADTVCRQLGYQRASDYDHLSMYEFDLHHNNIDIILTLNLFEWACM